MANVSRVGKWIDSVNVINENFKALDINIDELQSNFGCCKGLYPSLSLLEEMNPNPEDGSWAYVGTSFPAEVYIALDMEWINSGYTGSLDVELERYLNSDPLENGEDVLKKTLSWIYTNDLGETWRFLNGIILVHPDNITYTIRPKSLVFGYQGELLEKTITDKYLMEFLRGSGASFKSITITSSDNIVKTFEGGDLTWTIDSSYFYQVIDGEEFPRPPVDGDFLYVEFRFYDRNNEEQSILQYFKFKQ